MLTTLTNIGYIGYQKEVVNIYKFDRKKFKKFFQTCVDSSSGEKMQSHEVSSAFFVRNVPVSVRKLYYWQDENQTCIPSCVELMVLEDVAKVHNPKYKIGDFFVKFKRGGSMI